MKHVTKVPPHPKMFTKKPSKKEAQGKDYLTFHLRSSYPAEHWTGQYINVVSIDPGIVNFGFRIETRFSNGQVNTIALSRQCFSKTMIVEGNYTSLYSDISCWLDQYISYFSQCHVFIIEKQLPHNYQSIRVSQHLVTYFLFLLSKSPISPMLAEIDAKAKYKCLDAPTGFNETALKQWGTEYAIELLKGRNDLAALDLILGTKGIRKQKKQDDLCDTILQIEAFWVLFNNMQR